MKIALTVSGLLSFALLLTNCGPGFESKLPNYRTGYEPNVDIASLPLEKALRTKYSRLQLVCSETMTVTTLQDNGYDGSVESRTNPRDLVWDLLKDYKERKTFSIDGHDDLYTLSIKLDLKPKLIESLTSSTGASTYVMKNAAQLEGTETDELVIRTKQGVASSTTGSNARIFSDRVPSEIYNITVGPFKTDDKTQKKLSIQVTCTLEAAVKPGFENDWRETKN